MKILIVGGTSSLAKTLKPILSEFAEVITAGRADCDLHLDLSDSIDQIEIPEGVNVVINTAASFEGKNYEDIYSTENINVLGVLKLCQACKIFKVNHFVNISSMSAELEVTSDYFSIYALSKKQSDELTQLFCASFNLPFTILRPSQLYGNDSSLKKHQPFFYTIIDKAEKNEDIAIYGSRDALRNYLHIEDFAKIISLVVKNKIEGLYNCTNKFDLSLLDLANLAIKVFHSTGQVFFLKDKQNIKDNIFPYEDILYTKINYSPQITIEEGIRKIADFRLSKK